MHGLYFGTPYQLVGPSGQVASGSTGLFGDGSAAAPSISFASNSDTGFYLSGSQIHTSINNSQIVTFDANGVGVNSQRFYWVGRSYIYSPSDGNITFYNNAGTSFSLLQFGGTTSSFPALKRNADGLDLVRADDTTSSQQLRAQIFTTFNTNVALTNDGHELANDKSLRWSSTALCTGSKDLALKRNAANIAEFTDGSTGTGTVISNGAQIREGRLATATGIDLSSTNKQTLYTVPTGKTCYPTRFVVRDASAAITLATVTIGFDAGATDVVGATALTGLSDGTKYQILSPVTNPVEGAAAAVLGLDTTVQEGAADTVTIDVYGFLV